MALIVLSTGGTGGHIYPAVALGRELVQRGYQIALMGQLGGMEERIAQEENIPFYGVSAGKIDRTRPNPLALLKAGQGFLEARKYLEQLKPSVVVGFGGFASLPGVLSAQTLGIPTVLHEQNAKLGLTQKLAAAKAKIVATAYPEVQGLSAKKTHWVGVPVREERMDRQTALQKLGLENGPITILVMGGSQGSLALNEGVPGALEAVFSKVGLAALKHSDSDYSVQVLHATGRNHLIPMTPRVSHLPWYHITGFVDATAAWSAADIAITRAGSSTLGEAAYHGVPVVAIPLPTSADNHQLANAKAVEKAGAGKVLEQNNLNFLGNVIQGLIPQKARTEMQLAAHKISPQGASARLADAVVQLIHA